MMRGTCWSALYGTTRFGRGHAGPLNVLAWLLVDRVGPCTICTKPSEVRVGPLKMPGRLLGGHAGPLKVPIGVLKRGSAKAILVPL